jgi:hypothetical protein
MQWTMERTRRFGDWNQRLQFPCRESIVSPRLLDSVLGRGEGSLGPRRLPTYPPVVRGIDAGLQAKHGLISHDLEGESMCWQHWSARMQAQSY